MWDSRWHDGPCHVQNPVSCRQAARWDACLCSLCCCSRHNLQVVISKAESSCPGTHLFHALFSPFFSLLSTSLPHSLTHSLTHSPLDSIPSHFSLPPRLTHQPPPLNRLLLSLTHTHTHTSTSYTRKQQLSVCLRVTLLPFFPSHPPSTLLIHIPSLTVRYLIAPLLRSLSVALLVLSFCYFLHLAHTFLQYVITPFLGSRVL